jgi:hypothetical protein
MRSSSPIDWVKGKVRQSMVSYSAKLQTNANMKAHMGVGFEKKENNDGHKYFVVGKSVVGGSDVVRDQ